MPKIVRKKVNSERVNRKRIENAIKAMREGRRPQSKSKVDWDEIKKTASATAPPGMTAEEEVKRFRMRGFYDEYLRSAVCN